MIDDKSLILPDCLRVSVSICSAPRTRRRREHSMRYRTSQNPRSPEPARSAQPAPMKMYRRSLNNALARHQVVDIAGVALQRRDLRRPQATDAVASALARVVDQRRHGRANDRLTPTAKRMGRAHLQLGRRELAAAIARDAKAPTELRACDQSENNLRAPQRDSCRDLAAKRLLQSCPKRVRSQARFLALGKCLTLPSCFKPAVIGPA